MKHFGKILAALLCFGAVSAFAQDDNISVSVGGMTIAEVPFRVESIRTANSKFVSVAFMFTTTPGLLFTEEA